MRIVLLIVLGMMGGLTVFNRRYVAPYDSFGGQVMLVAVVAMLFLGGLLWLRKLASPTKVDRFLVVDAVAAGQVVGETASVREQRAEVGAMIAALLTGALTGLGRLRPGPGLPAPAPGRRDDARADRGRPAVDDAPTRWRPPRPSGLSSRARSPG